MEACREEETILFYAFGTRGDVQPLAILAKSLATGRTKVRFVSHMQHQSFLSKIWRGEKGNFIDFTPTCSPPHAPPSGSDMADDSRLSTVEILRPEEHLRVCIEACRSSNHLPTCIIGNLFALEAVHIAEAFGIPLLMVHPYVIPSTPKNLARRFQRSYPHLYRSFQNNPPPLTTWEDVEHWMWPTFTDTWRSFREMLGLKNHGSWLRRPAPPLLYLYSESIIPEPGYWPAADEYTGHIHVVGYVVERKEDCINEPPPPSVCSFFSSSTRQVRPILVTFGTMVTLGVFNPFEESAAILAEAFAGLNQDSQEEYRIILDGAASSTWYQALQSTFSDRLPPSSFHVLEEAISHSWILPKCSMIVHHGGSGTTAAAFQAGISQVVLPFMADQFQWRERVSWLGVGPAAAASLEGHVVFPSSSSNNPSVVEKEKSRAVSVLKDAMKEALEPSLRLRAAGLGQRLRRETQTEEKCLQIIRCHLQQYFQLTAAAADVPPDQMMMVDFDDEAPIPAGCSLLSLEEDSRSSEGEEEGLEVLISEGSQSEVLFLHQEIFKGGSGYLQHGIKVKEGDVVVDVGANIGLFALYLELYVMERPGQFQLWAIEPAPRTFEVLQWNLKHYAIPHQALQIALGEVNARGILRYYPHMPGNSSMSKRPPQGLNHNLKEFLLTGQEDIEVEIQRFSDFAKVHDVSRVDLLKVDVEDFEESVLKGIEEDSWRNIRQLVAEVHDTDGRRDRIDALLRFRGKFEHVVWEKAAWASAAGLDNWMVFARRIDR